MFVSKFELAAVVLIVVVTLAVVFWQMYQEKQATSKPRATPQASAAPEKPQQQQTPEAVETLIHFQANDKCVVKLNDREIGSGAGMKATTLSGGKTVKGDVLTFIVTNDESWGGLRAMVKRGDETYKTGQDEFTLADPDAQWTLVKETKYADAAKNDWAPFETDAPVALMGAEWIWNENNCSRCTVLFRLVL